MLIVCPSCATSYDVEAASVPPEGRQVRCARCAKIWHASSPHAERLLAAAHAIAPDPSDPVATGGSKAPQTIDAEPMAPELTAQEAAAGPGRLDETIVAPAAGEAGEGEADQQSGGTVAEEGSFPVPALAGAGEAPVEDGAEVVDVPPMVPATAAAGSGAVINIDAARVTSRHSDAKAGAPRRRPRRAASRFAVPLSGITAAIVVLLLADAALFGWRKDIVRALPQTASFYAWFGMPVNLRGLVFTGLTTTTEQHEGVPILLVEGSIANHARNQVDVPRLQFVVRNAARQEIYSWNAAVSPAALPPGEVASFRSRLASPPGDARDVLVRFVNRHDILAGSR